MRKIMTTPLLELEGTWDEISAQMSGFADQRLHILVYSVTTQDAPVSDARPIGDVLAEIAAKIPSEELAKLPADFTDQLDHYVYGTPKQ
jgi:hypothetical protein